ncbi:Stk1 family PASTA domain-containing Ser/Thr kinase [Kocuria sp. cx-455]|uniref:Stk1 family PASTA domain-containing Ser/Thr kinase n=1 Tax=Kocuria sp. cx-455 TaxID=2771377 RepID=UPI003D702C82
MGMPTMPDLINERYKVGEVIGRGGMATVHLGEDVRLGRLVAIKVLRPELAADDTFHERFQREAQAVASLNHHTIVSIYDTGEITPQSPDGVTRPYIVMEYVPGQTLRELIHGKGIEPDQAIEYMLGILDALSFSHRAGIVHRDIKPANVKVTPDGAVKVMDFGIARAVEDTQAALTQSQAVLGTAQYLSPEQARGVAVDARSDLYSAACVLFEMLTGRAPFVGESSVAIAAQHVRDAPPAPSALNPQLPQSVDRFMEKALAKDRDYRFSDAAQMRRALRTVLAQLPDDLEATQALDTTKTMDSNTKALPAVGAGVGTGAVVAAGRSETAEHAAYTDDASAHYGLDPDEDTGGRVGSAAADPAARHDKRRGRWILPAVLAVLLLTGLGIAGVMGVQWWQEQQAQQPAMVSVPQVEGMDRTTAENTLRDAQLEPTFSTENSDSVPERHVITMDPSAGSQVEAGSGVAVTVSDGPATVDVPNTLVGQSLDNARNALREAGLSVGAVSTVNSATVPENVVLSTDPAGGTTVEKDSAVQLQVSTGRVTVPDVVGMSRTEAQDALRADDVRLNYNIAVRDSEEESTGTVLEQSAPAGSAVAQGSTITLTIAREVTPSPTATPEPSDEPTQDPTPSTGPESDGDGQNASPSPSRSQG